jgi:hypothetical protein
MRDLTVLRQLAAHLDGWGALRAQVVTDRDWPSVRVAADGPEGAALVWRCVDRWWAGQLVEAGGDGEPVATIQTGIGAEASAGEVADALKVIYRLLGSVAASPGAPPTP